MIRNSSLINALLWEVEVQSPHTQTNNFLSLSTGYDIFQFIIKSFNHDEIHEDLKSWTPADVLRLNRRTLAGGPVFRHLA